jgi:hypothetical protein
MNECPLSFAKKKNRERERKKCMRSIPIYNNYVTITKCMDGDCTGQWTEIIFA